MSYRALELKDGRVALLPGDVPIVFARLEEEFLPADPTTNGNARIPGKVKERAPRKAKRTGRMTMSDKLPVVAPPPARRSGGRDDNATGHSRAAKPEARARALEIQAEHEDWGAKQVWEQLVKEKHDVKYSSVWGWLNK